MQYGAFDFPRPSGPFVTSIARSSHLHLPSLGGKTNRTTAVTSFEGGRQRDTLMTDDGEKPQLAVANQRTADGSVSNQQPLDSPTSTLLGPETSQPLALLIKELQCMLHEPASTKSDSLSHCLPPNSTSAGTPGDASMIFSNAANSAGLSAPLTGLPTTFPPANIDNTLSFCSNLASQASSGLPSAISNAYLDSSAPNNIPNAAQQGSGNNLLATPQQSALLCLDSLNRLQEIARQTSIPQCQVPSLASLLTPADTALLTSLLALQQRQYAQQLSNGDLLLSSLRPGNSRNQASSAPSSLYKETGACRYGSKCQFAHGPNELRPVQRHPKYKTETGTCPYGTRCRFIHFFHRPALNPAAALLKQAGLPGSLPQLAQNNAASSLEAYLASLSSNYGLANPGGLAGLPQTNNLGQANSGMYIPPLPPTVNNSLSMMSGLPSLDPQPAGVITNCKGNAGLPNEAHRRLPVFKTFTEANAGSATFE